MNSLKSSFLIGTVFAAVVSVSTGAHAGSPITEVFLANATPNIDFLDRSSRMALDNSKSVKVKDFARSQAKEQTLAANSLYDLAQREASAPVQSGRSAAIDGQVAIVDNRLPMSQEDLDSIEGLSGVEFDEAYRAKQRSALLQLQQDYEDYIAKGDDADLKSLAAGQLPTVRKRLAGLAKV